MKQKDENSKGKEILAAHEACQTVVLRGLRFEMCNAETLDYSHGPGCTNLTFDVRGLCLFPRNVCDQYRSFSDGCIEPEKPRTRPKPQLFIQAPFPCLAAQTPRMQTVESSLTSPLF